MTAHPVAGSFGAALQRTPDRARDPFDPPARRRGNEWPSLVTPSGKRRDRGRNDQSAETSESGNQFRARFKNAVGEATSKAATLTVQQTPAITKQPVSVTVEEGQNAVFEATASGSPSPTIKWETSAHAGKTWTAVAGVTSGRFVAAKDGAHFSPARRSYPRGTGHRSQRRSAPVPGIACAVSSRAGQSTEGADDVNDRARSRCRDARGGWLTTSCLSLIHISEPT